MPVLCRSCRACSTATSPAAILSITCTTCSGVGHGAIGSLPRSHVQTPSSAAQVSTHKQAIAESGGLRQRVTPLARIAPCGRESSTWAVKQALDIGLMGLIFPSIDTPERALAAVRAMRYPQRRGSPYPEPSGLRGAGPSTLGAVGRRIRAAGRPLAAQPGRRSRRRDDDRVGDGRAEPRCNRRGAGSYRLPHRSERPLQLGRGVRWSSAVRSSNRMTELGRPVSYRICR